MYGMLRLFSFLLRAVAIINVLMFPFVYAVAQFAATAYAIPVGVLMPTSYDPTPFIVMFAVYSTAIWIIFACIGVYALAQFIELQVRIGNAMAARRRRQQVEQYQSPPPDPRYQGYDEVPKDGNWASMPERPGTAIQLPRHDDEDQRRNVWISRL